MQRCEGMLDFWWRGIFEGYRQRDTPKKGKAGSRKNRRGKGGGSAVLILNGNDGEMNGSQLYSLRE